jgi:FtsH-binding integral membrane protein
MRRVARTTKGFDHMADYDNQVLRGRGVTADQAIDQGLRSYMISVYNYMMIGLGVTGLAAYFVSHTPAIYTALFGSPLVWLVILAPLAVVFFLSFGINRISASTAQMLFWLYSGLVGISLATVFMVYPIGDIARVFFITAASFGALSLYGYTTKTNLSAFGSFLFIGLIGIILASVVNFFMASSALQFAISVAGVLIFAGLTAWDTQRIKEMYWSGDDAEASGKKAVMGALALYLDFLNMFLFLLRLLGSNRN